jgi:hypothetical protein
MLKIAWGISAIGIAVGCNSGDGAQPQVDEAFQVHVKSVGADWLEARVGQHVPIYAPPGADFTTHHFGRTDVEFPSGPTRVGVEVAGLDWRDGDSLELVAPNVGLSIHGLEAHFAYPTPGSTTIAGQSLDWSRAGAPLVTAARGDTAWVAQMSTMPSMSGTTISVLTRAGTASGLTIADGQATALRATLAPVAQDRSLDLRWNGTEFAALATQVAAHARPAPAPALSIRTLPASLADNNAYFDSLYMYLPSVVDFGPVRGSEDFEQPIRYGNPFSTAASPWREFVTMVYAMPVLVPHVGATHALAIQAVPVEALANGGAIRPVLGPVRNVTINGRSAADELTGVGASPTVSWDPPALGTATSYTVTVQAIDAQDGIKPVSQNVTHTTSVTLPAAAAETGGSYLLTVTAISSPGRDLSVTPFAGTLPFASTDYVTAPIAP